MTIKEASQKSGIPRSRIQKAIQRGWLKSAKVKGAHQFSGSEFDAIANRCSFATRKDRTFAILMTEELRVRGKNIHTFQTNAAADEFELMMNE